MGTKKLRGMVDPTVFSSGGIHRVKWVVDTVVFFVRFPYYQQSYILVGVVDKGVAYPRSGRKTDAVSWLQLPQITVDPHLWMTFNNVDKLFLVTFCMRIGSATTRR